MNAERLTFGSLFAGIGGLDLGLERAGMVCKWQVEIDPYATRVLENHWPNVQRFGDVKLCGSHNLKPVDLICGGFPCQDISNASAASSGRQGLEGTRSGLWNEMHRIVNELRPRFIIVENVSALTFRGLDRVLADLSESGYDAEWDCVPASFFGAPHRRERLFLVAYPNQVGSKNGAHSTVASSRSQEWKSTQHIEGGQQWKSWAIAASQAVDGEISASDFCGMDDGLSKELDAIGSYGNAVVPQIAEWIGRRILETSHEVSRLHLHGPR